jgi:hypothetical protein
MDAIIGGKKMESYGGGYFTKEFSGTAANYEKIW